MATLLVFPIAEDLTILFKVLDTVVEHTMLLEELIHLKPGAETE